VPKHAIDMEALKQGFAALVDDRGLEPAIVAFALLPDIFHGEAGMDRVADNSGFEKAAALFAVMPTMSRP
jgi:hypothetical protein